MFLISFPQSGIYTNSVDPSVLKQKPWISCRVGHSPCPAGFCPLILAVTEMFSLVCSCALDILPGSERTTYAAAVHSWGVRGDDAMGMAEHSKIQPAFSERFLHKMLHRVLALGWAQKHRLGGLNHRSVFLTVLEVVSPDHGAGRQIWFLVRVFFLAYRCCVPIR